MIIIILAVLAGVVFVLTDAGYRKAFSMRGKEATGFYDYFFSLYPELTARPFSCPSGKESIYGVRLQYGDDPKGLILMIHGFGLNMEHYFPQAEYLAKAGYNVVLFDGVGLGRSSGAAIRGLPQHLADTAAVLDYIRSAPEISGLPLMLYGHSWGGYAANTVSCLEDYSIKAILSLAGYHDSLGAMRTTIRARYGAFGHALMLPIAIYERIIFGHAASYTAVQGLSLVNCPVLIIHCKDDPVLSFEDNFGRIKKALSDKPGIRFLAVDGAYHNLGVPAEVDERVRRLQKHIRYSPDADEGMQKELWDLQLTVDEEMLKRFLEFYDQSIQKALASAK